MHTREQGCRRDNGCNYCKHDRSCKQNSCPVGMSYTPSQCFDNLFPAEVAITKGTIFCDLYKPFCGKTIGRNC